MATAVVLILPPLNFLIAAVAPSIRGWMFSCPGVAMNSATSPLPTSLTIRWPIA